MNHFILTTSVAALLSASPLGLAQEAKREPTADAKSKTTASVKDKPDPDPSFDFFKGMSTGIALIKPKRKTIREASIVNGKVVVSSEAEIENTLMLVKTFPFSETSDKRCQGPEKWASCAAWMLGAGFNIGAPGSSGQVVDFLGVGLTVGSGQEAEDSSAWYAGFGIGRRFNQKVLGDGLRENQPLPAGETQIRYKHIDATAPFVFFSLRW